MASPSAHASADPASDSPWIAVARLLRPQGRRGELLADPLTDLLEVFSASRAFRLAPGTPSQPAAGTPALPPTVVVEDCWQPTGRNAGRLVLKLAGVDSISAAEAYDGYELLLRETDLPALDDDTFLVRDLLGCMLYDTGQPVGTITDLQFAVGPDGRTRLPDAVDLLVIDPLPSPADPNAPNAVGAETDDSASPAAEPVLVPFVKAWLISVDLPAKRLTMHLPPGLFDTPEDL